MQTSVAIAAVTSNLLHNNVQYKEAQVRSVVIVMTLLSSSALAFDINGYCRQVANAVGGSYQIEETCRQQERQAQANLARNKIPLRIESYCRDVGQAVGGSYQIMLTCVQQELAAKARLQ